ncbi:MAG: sulfite exporter TauE/SafE family protein [Clostridia bacterium]|nr:sulfite exporter TauE/SafE family protein [Clostridia bacterium]
MIKYIWFFLAGAIGGVLGGMGMGGGTLLIPILTFFLEVEQKTAQAINLFSFVPMAIIALILQAKNKLIDMKGLLPLTVSAVALSLLGGYILRFINGDMQTKLFGGFLTILAVAKFIMTLKAQKQSKKKEDSAK